MELIFQLPNGELATITLQPQSEHIYSVQLNERSLSARIEVLPSGALRISLDGQEVIVNAIRQDKAHHLQLQGKRLTLEKTTPRRRTQQQAAPAGDLSANLHGQVTKILVAEGDWVEKGQTLVILEAMKMETRIRAPQDGQVKKILCELGQAVERGQKVAEMLLS